MSGRAAPGCHGDPAPFFSPAADGRTWLLHRGLSVAEHRFEGAPLRRRRAMSLALLSLVLAASAGQRLGAQSPDRQITGVVMDEAGQPLPNAIVALDPGATAVTIRTNAQGRFRFPRVSQGRHVVAVSWIGHAPDSRTVEMMDARLELTITLRRIPVALSEVTVVGRRSGVAGIVVSREDLRPLAGAIVSANGTTVTGTIVVDTTDEHGHFDLPTPRAGGFVVMAKRPGFQPLFRSVTASEDSLVELGLVLDSIETDRDRRLAIALQEFESRMKWKGANAAIVAGDHEFKGYDGQRLFDVIEFILNRHEVLRKKGLRIDNACWFFFRQPPADPNESYDFRYINASDIEAVEVYGAGADLTRTLVDRLPERTGRMCGVDVRETVEPRQVIATGPMRNPGRVAMVVVWLKSLERD